MKKTLYLQKLFEKISYCLYGCNGNELLVHVLLNLRGIKHKMQVHVNMPEVARNSKYIIVDFVLPKYKGQEVWIEYNGPQHYHFVGLYHKSYEDFAKQQRRDQVERDYCEQHHIRLIEVRHSRNYFKTMWKLNKEL